MFNESTSIIREGQTKTKETSTFVSIETTAYSGATLLSYLIGAHPEIATVAEMSGLLPKNDPNDYLCSCGKIIVECEFWQSVISEMKKRGYEFNLGNFGTLYPPPYSKSILDKLKYSSVRNHYIDSFRDRIVYAIPSESHRLKKLTSRNAALIESVLTVTGKKIFVDSSKDRLRLPMLKRYSNIHVKAIHLVRDVRGVVNSDIRHGKVGDIKAYATGWYKRHRRLQILMDTKFKGSYLRVRYEDLCRNPSDTMSKIFQFCGGDPDFRIGDLQDIEHHLVGNSMRLKGVSEIRLDEKWRNSLTPNQLEIINRVAGGLSREFGYQWD